MQRVGEGDAIKLTDNTSRCWTKLCERANERELQIKKNSIAYDYAIRIANKVDSKIVPVEVLDDVLDFDHLTAKRN